MKIISRLTYSVITLFMVLALFLGAADKATPEKVSYISDTSEKSIEAGGSEKGVNAVCDSFSADAKLFGILPIGKVNVSVYPELSLIPGGDVFGVKFFTKGVIVVGTNVIETENGNVDPAQKAGIRAGDIIERVGGENVNSVEELADIVEKSRGETLGVYYKRNGSSHNTEITPYLSLADGKYNTGLWVRDSTAGIGTVTFYDPESKTFAGLGHGICDVDTGIVMPMLRSSVVDISLFDTIKGREGTPGELKGSFGTKKRGELIGNTDSGVFGVFDSIPEREALKIGLSKEVHEGEATIFSDVDGYGAKEYSIEISRIYPLADTKNFLIRITDKELIEKTGGIVQGMSGSPIIQDGKLIGAVTHVLVGDPKKGYGIFIENMLGSMESLPNSSAA